MKQVPEARDILRALDAVKSHKIFNRSPLMCAFLSYVTLETIQGRESRISAYSVAVDALGKPTDFDPQMDPSVRVLAKRLRDSLARYYEEATDYDLCIVLKPGSYVPSFHHARPSMPSCHQHLEPTDHEKPEAIEDPVASAPRDSWSTPVVNYRTDDPQSECFARKKNVLVS